MKLKKTEKIEKSYFIEISNNNSNITIGDIDITKTIFDNFDSFIKNLKDELNKDNISEDNKKRSL